MVTIYQSSEFLLEHGIIDAIVERKNLKATLARTLAWFVGGGSRGAANLQSGVR